MYKKDNQQMNYQQKLELRILFGQTKFVFKKKKQQYTYSTHTAPADNQPISNIYGTNITTTKSTKGVDHPTRK